MAELTQFRFKCPECPIVAFNFQVLDSHVTQQHAAEYDQFRTTFCEKELGFGNKCDQCGMLTDIPQSAQKDRIA